MGRWVYAETVIMNVVRILIAVAVLVPAIYFIHSLFKYTSLISRIFLGLVYEPQIENFSSSRGEKISILDSAGHEIQAHFVENKGSQKALIFCPESGASKDSWEKYAFFFPGWGFHVLSVDLKPSDPSSPSQALAQWPCQDDVERLVTAIRWAKKAVGASSEIYLFGVSNGSNMALGAASMEESVKGVICDGLFSMKEIFREYIRRWAPMLVKPAFIGERLPEWVVNLYANLGFWYSQKQSKTRFVDAESLLGRRKKPLLLIHGENDDYVTTSHQRLLERFAGQRSGYERLFVPEARHNQSVAVAREAYEKRIFEFLEKLK